MICPCCETEVFALNPKDGITRRRLNTCYNDEENNFITSCKVCYDGLVAMFEEQWAEYYSGRL